MSENRKLLRIVYERVKATNKAEAFTDALAVLQEEYDEAILSDLRKRCVQNMRSQGGDSEEFYELYKLALLISAPRNFDSYMQYLEIDRRPEDRFYLPRRRVLYPVVREMQRLADGEIMELFLTCPPRVGKTTLALMYVTWIMGRDTELPNLYSSYSDTLTRPFYTGVLEILTDEDTYNYPKIFPGIKISKQNAADEILDLGRMKHYPTLTCRSLYGTLNGACDAEGGIIVADDLLSGIEEALNPDRLDSTWKRVDNNLIPRGKETTRYLWIGTRWSTNDPQGKRLDVLQNDPRFTEYPWKYINIPALNDKDESNFEYNYNKGFSTAYYRRRRASFERHDDMASWFAQYMGRPIEREGTLFSAGSLRYYDGELPKEAEPDRIFMFVDPAWGGGDYVAGPVCYQYGENDIYVPDVVYNNGDKSVTQPLVADKIITHNVAATEFEGTKTTASYAEGVMDKLKVQDFRTNIRTTTKNWTGTGKEMRIKDKAPEIRDRMIFLSAGRRSKEYEMFMQNVFSFKIMGKNKHDDAPDSLAGAISMTNRKPRAKAIIKQRPF